MAKHRTQELVGKLVPRSWAAAMEAESREWMVHCRTCGAEQSVWDLGGVRWKAKGTKWTFRRCPECGKRGWHKVYRRERTELAGDA
jgi:hypothetical protein